MLEWLSANWWAVWLVAAVLLAVSEALTLDFTLLMLAAGALAGAGTALLFPGLLLVQVVVAVAVAFSLLFLLRPTLLAASRCAPCCNGTGSVLLSAWVACCCLPLPASH